MTKLTVRQRKEMPAEDFALPEKRAFPMPDKNHVDMAWKMVDRKEDLNDEERSAARKAILKRAHKFGMDTTGWNASANISAEAFEELKAEAVKDSGVEQSMSFQCMAVSVPEFKDHPNKAPFHGVLTLLDTPSDMPTEGSNGKKVILPTDVAEKALASLLQMSVDFCPNFDGHDPTRKIGLIEEAYIEGKEIIISGFLYALDFPVDVERIQRDKKWLGFSFEAQVFSRALDDGTRLITHCVFTGAAILYKDKAAFQQTSLSASAQQEIDMTTEIMAALSAMQEQNKALQSRFDSVETELKSVKASSSMPMMDKVKPHADAIHAAADSMCAAGIGADMKNGHAAVLHNVANHMMASAAMGQVPHIYRDHDFTAGLSAGAEPAAVSAAAAVVTPPAENEALNKVLDALKSFETRVSDVEKARFHAASAPARAAIEITPQLEALMAKGDMTLSKEKKVTIDAVDRVLEGKGLTRSGRMATKLQLRASGAMEGAK